MTRTHPHAEASYRVVTLPSGAFGVEVSIPNTLPTTVSAFATEADAQAWIANHKNHVSEDVPTVFSLAKEGRRRTKQVGERWRSSRITVLSGTSAIG